MTETRRSDDDPLYKRMANLEGEFMKLDRQVDRLSLDQQHQSDMSAAHFSGMQKTTELAIAKIETLSKDINMMASEANQTPAGRAILSAVAVLNNELSEQQREIRVLSEWQTGAKAALLMIGSIGGLVSTAVLLLKAVGVIQP